MRQLAAYCDSAGLHGVSFRTVDVKGNWASRAADGTQTFAALGNWNWDGPPGARWSRFFVIVYPGTLFAPYPFDWGDTAGPGWGEYIDTHDVAPTVGSTMTAEQVATMRAIVSLWKPEGTRGEHIVLAFDPASFDPASPEPDGLWGKSYKYVSGVAVPSRLSTARYLRGS